MFELIVTSIPILVSDVLNPVLLAGVIFGLGSRRPFLNSTLLLLGWFVTYFAAGILLALGLDAIIDFFKTPRPIDFVIETVLGLLLIGLGVYVVRSGQRHKKGREFDDADTLSAGTSFWIGASINLIGMPFAIPYFAFLGQILKADLDWMGALMVLLIYNLLYVLPFSLLIFIRLIYRQESDVLFKSISDAMEWLSAILMPILLFLVGGALLADAFVFFSTGNPLF
jgi:cytochrome c biogenesis protein CcdA